MGLFDKLFGKKGGGNAAARESEYAKPQKVFEDYFSELQADMVSVCLEYVENKADKIYIYGSCEKGIIAGDCFYDICGHVLHKHKLNDATAESFHYDVSMARQKAVLEILQKDMQAIKALCQEHQRDMPTEIKITYDVRKKSLNAEYKYEPVYSADADKTDYHIFNEWYDEIGKSNG